MSALWIYQVAQHGKGITWRKLIEYKLGWFFKIKQNLHLYALQVQLNNCLKCVINLKAYGWMNHGSLQCFVYYRPKSCFFGVHLRTEFGFNDALLGSQAFNLKTVLSEKLFDSENFYEQIIQDSLAALLIQSL